jgi:hypothetical protein
MIGMQRVAVLIFGLSLALAHIMIDRSLLPTYRHTFLSFISMSSSRILLMIDLNTRTGMQ